MNHLEMTIICQDCGCVSFIPRSEYPQWCPVCGSEKTYAPNATPNSLIARESAERVKRWTELRAQFLKEQQEAGR